MRIGIVAGEMSGDQLGEDLVKVLKINYPDAIIEGIAGPKMQAAGCRTLHNMEDLSVMGISEVLLHLPKILKIRSGIIKYFSLNKPDIFIGIDAPDFNLGVEKRLKKIGIKTIHYVSPSVWAWRENRMITIKKATDLVFAILPFEENFYAKHNHKAVFVGHPLANTIPVSISDNSNFKNSSIKKIAILPGSRKQEVKKLLPIFIQALEILVKKNYKFEAVLPIANQNLKKIILQHRVSLDKLNVKYTEEKSHDVFKISDFAIIASGTATLEAMLYKVPMVVAYKVSFFSSIIGKFLLKINLFSLPNILANEKVVSELIQKNCNAENCANEMIKFFDDPEIVLNMQNKFIELHKKLQQNTASKILNAIKALIHK